MHPVLQAVLSGHTQGVDTLAWSPDSRHLASGSFDHTVIIWDVSDPHQPVRQATLSGHTDAVFSVGWSPTGTHLASGSQDRTVIIWDVSNPAHPLQAAAPLTGHTNSVSAVAWSPDGNHISSGSDDRSVIIWDARQLTVRTEDALSRACIISGGGLTQVEWSHYVPDISYRDTCATR
jgi:WD40 repeat protein